MLSSTKPAALAPLPGIIRRVEMVALYRESIKQYRSMPRNPLWKKPLKLLQLFSLEKLNG